MNGKEISGICKETLENFKEFLVVFRNFKEVSGIFKKMIFKYLKHIF